MKTFGIVLLIGGIILTAFTGFKTIKKQTISDNQDIEKHTPVYASPITGLVLTLEATMILVAFKRRKPFLKP